MRLISAFLLALAVCVGSLAETPGTDPVSCRVTSVRTESDTVLDRQGVSTGHSVPDTLTLGVTGDIMLGSWLIEVLGERGAAWPFEDVLPVLRSTDLLVGNLESPFLSDTTGITPAEKTYTFAVPPGLIETITAGGFDLVGLANNHILDYGPAGLYETWDTLDSAGIAHVGTGLTKAEAHTHTILDRKGRQVAFLAYSHTFPEEFWATSDRPGTAPASDEGLAREVRRAEAAADLVVVMFHWGGELLEEPREYQQILARIAIDNGADLVIGHHPHTIQPLEWYRDRLIAYSLGNFIFGSYTSSAKGAILLVRFSGDRPTGADFYPVDVNNFRREFRPGLVEPARWPLLNSAVISSLADSAAAGHRGVEIGEAGYLRLLPPGL
jgi:poly-gamma-glutamate capsule biosynthesis protein CapA/YwtB (metallophosphatase superfamily)